MLEISHKQKKTQDICRPANDLDLLVYEPYRGLRYVLETIYTFHQSCAVLGLPVSDPFSFLQAMLDKLRPENRDAFQLEGKQQDPLAYRSLFVGLLLTYVCYGDLLFCIGHPVKKDFPKTVEALRRAPPMLIQELLDINQVRETLGEMMRLSQQNKIYELFSELQYLEKMNENSLALLRSIESAKGFLQQQMHIMDVPKEFATQLFDIFLEFYKQQQSIVDDNRRKDNMPSVSEQRTRLENIFDLRAQATKFAELVTERKTLDAAVLKQYTDKLVAWLNAQTAWLPPQMIKFRNVLLECETEEPKISARMRSESAQLAGLAQLRYDQISFDARTLKMLQNRLQLLLNSYQDDLLYQFFNRMYCALHSMPQLQEFAPTYVWRLFVRYQTPLFKGAKSLFAGEKSVDFSLKAMLFDWQPDLRSEERTSISHAKHDLDLFNALTTYFKERPLEHPVNLPMCEFLIQRMLLTQMSVESDTSIFSTPLRHAKPLFRGLALIHDALEQMGCELWKQMPCESEPTVSLEEADAFYQDTRPRCKQTKVMSYLLERAGEVPDRSKKNLKLMECQKMTQLLACACSGYEQAEVSAAELLEKLDAYINEREVLQEYAGQSQQNREKVRYAICRLAVERTAHELSRETLRICAELFALPILAWDLQRMWKMFFAERPESRRWKMGDDLISIGNMEFTSRCWCWFPAARFMEKVWDERFGAVVLTGTSTQAICFLIDCIDRLVTFPIFYQYDSNLSWDQTDFSDVQKIAWDLCEFGFAGIILPIDLCAMLLKNVDKQEENDRILGLFQKYQWISAFLKQERAALPAEFLLMVQICIQAVTREEEESARVLTRWCLEDGADAVLLKFDCPMKEGILSGIAESQPGPVLLSLPHSQKDKVNLLLRNTEIHAIVIDEPQVMSDEEDA